MLELLKSLMPTDDTIKRAIRTFVIGWGALVIPGFLGWLHGLTDWANSNGQAPFPDGRSLLYLVISAITAGLIAVVNLLWNAIEDYLGVGLLRDPTATKELEALDKAGLPAGTDLPVYDHDDDPDDTRIPDAATSEPNEDTGGSYIGPQE